MNSVLERHIRKPSNLGVLPGPDGHANPTGECGESIELFLYIADGLVREASFIPHGCAFTTACGSVLTELVQGRALDEAFDITAQDIADELGGLPADHAHCAALAAGAVKEAISYYYRDGSRNWKALYR